MFTVVYSTNLHSINGSSSSIHSKSPSPVNVIVAVSPLAVTDAEAPPPIID